MVASAAGGFLFSEFLKQRNAKDMRAMRDELKDLRAFIAQGREQARASDAPGMQQAGMLMPIATEGVEDTVEWIAYVPACRRTDAATAWPKRTRSASPCAAQSRPTRASTRSSCSRSPTPSSIPWESHQAAFEQDLGGARFTGKSFEYAQANELKAVCVNSCSGAASIRTLRESSCSTVSATRRSRRR